MPGQYSTADVKAAGTAPLRGKYSAADIETASAPPAGFWESVGNAINPMPAIREWLNRPQSFNDAAGAIHVLNAIDREAAADPANKGKHRSEWKRREPTSEEAAAIERGMSANLQGAESNALSDAAAPAAEAGRQASDGNLSGAAGTLVGGYVVPAVAGAIAPKIPAAARSTAKAAGTAAKVAMGALESPVVRDVAGTISPRAVHALALVDRIKKAAAAFRGADAPAEATPAAAAPAAATLDPNSPSWTGAPSMRRTVAPPPAQQPTGQLRDLVRPPAAVEAPPAASVPAGEGGAYPIPPEARSAPGAPVPKEQYQSAARTVKARALARWLNVGGIPYEDAVLMTPDHWAQAAEAAGVNKPSAESIGQALNELRKMQPKAEAPAAAAPASSQSAPVDISARQVQARKLAELLYGDGNGVPHADALRMDPRMWAQAAQTIGVEPPSPGTVKVALQELQRMEKAVPIARRLAEEMRKP